MARLPVAGQQNKLTRATRKTTLAIRMIRANGWQPIWTWKTTGVENGGSGNNSMSAFYIL
ncbi:MAG: hypothetical protein WCP62_16995 [Planctomycetota bacterium]